MKSRQLFERLDWPVSAKAPFDIRIRFGDGEPPFAAVTGHWFAVLHLRAKKDEPDWSIWVAPPEGAGTEIWEGSFMSNALELPPLVDLVAFPGWLRDVRARTKGALSVAHLDAGRNGKAEPHIQRWLGWDSTVLTSTTSARTKETSLIDWANAPPPKFYVPKLLAADQKRVARQLVTDTGELSGPELRRVVDRIVDQGALFLKPVLAAPLPESVRLSLSDSLGDPSRFHASPLQHLFLAIALRSASLEEIASYFKTVGGFPSRIASMIERRTKLGVTPSLVHAATEACLRFELPRYLGSCSNEDASIFMLLAMDGSQASAEALRRLVGILHAASDAGRSDTDHHGATALSVAKQVGSAAFQRVVVG